MKKLGKGRSGVVFANEEKPIAHKVFVGSKLANLVHYVFSGAPNPYTWNEHAIQCAHLRRNILTKLVEFWFEGKASVADAQLSVWNEEHKAYELQAELVNGSPALLKNPFYQKCENDFERLVSDIMRPLQQKLIESGFDGLVWQAGLGNPVAANNFLYAERWLWIDLESGVPALIPLNPLPLFSFYLPKSWRHRCALFDDVDIAKLQNYLQQNKTQIIAYCEEEQFALLVKNTTVMGDEQKKWKNSKRLERALTYHFKKQKISQQQKQFYAKFPPLWYMREMIRVIRLVIVTLFFSLPKKAIVWIFSQNYWRLFKKGIKFFISQKYREQKARNYVIKQIKGWQQRKQISQETASDLEQRTHRENSSAFITDFGVHLAIKPFVKTFEYVIVPILYLQGSIGGIALSVLLIVIAGPLARSLYTLMRLVQAQFQGQRKPWMALFVGVFPIIGNMAYPIQMLYSASSEDKVASFIFYDTMGKFGRYMPIWGGEDTATEHFFNKIAHVMLGLLGKGCEEK